MEKFCTHCGTPLDVAQAACLQCGKSRSIASRIASNPRFRQVADWTQKALRAVAAIVVRNVKLVWQDVVSIFQISARVLSEESPHSSRFRSAIAKGSAVWGQLNHREALVLFALPSLLAATLITVSWSGTDDSSSANRPSQPQSEMDIVIGWFNAMPNTQFCNVFKGNAQAVLNSPFDESFKLKRLYDLLARAEQVGCAPRL